jgi:hypothetical protein
VGSKPTQGIDVCVRLFCVCVFLCVGSGLVTGRSPVKRVLPTVYWIKKLLNKIQCEVKFKNVFAVLFVSYMSQNVSDRILFTLLFLFSFHALGPH